MWLSPWIWIRRRRRRERRSGRRRICIPLCTPGIFGWLATFDFESQFRGGPGFGFGFGAKFGSGTGSGSGSVLKSSQGQSQSSISTLRFSDDYIRDWSNLTQIKSSLAVSDWDNGSTPIQSYSEARHKPKQFKIPNCHLQSRGPSSKQGTRSVSISSLKFRLRISTPHSRSYI